MGFPFVKAFWFSWAFGFEVRVEVVMVMLWMREGWMYKASALLIASTLTCCILDYRFVNSKPSSKVKSHSL